MRLSSFDQIFTKLNQENKNILYGGYNTRICVLGPALKGLELVDKITIFPYHQQKEIIWEGLNIIDYVIVPHYQSNHPES